MKNGGSKARSAKTFPEHVHNVGFSQRPWVLGKFRKRVRELFTSKHLLLHEILFFFYSSCDKLIVPSCFLYMELDGPFCLLLFTAGWDAVLTDWIV